MNWIEGRIILIGIHKNNCHVNIFIVVYDIECTSCKLACSSTKPVWLVLLSLWFYKKTQNWYSEILGALAKGGELLGVHKARMWIQTL